jgi:ribosomal-protein-alanine N-acetyltransferase
MAMEKLQIFCDIETERLFLRKLGDQDLEFVFKQFSDPLVSQYLYDEAPLVDKSGAKEIINFFKEQDGKSYNRWGMVIKNTSEMIGTIGFHHWDKERFHAEIGYDLYPDWWGKGFMTEAMMAVLCHGFEVMNLNRIEAFIYPENERSMNLAKKFGFQMEGILRDYFYLNGQFYDHVVLSLLKREWKLK